MQKPTPKLIFLTVYDRAPLTLANTLRSLSKSNLDGSRVVVIDDGSSVDYLPIRDAFNFVEWHRINTLEDPGAYHIHVVQDRAEACNRRPCGRSGTNNPARAFNAGLSFWDGEDAIVFLASDVILPPNILDSVDRCLRAEMMFTPRVVDMDTGSVFSSADRPWPMPWLLAAPASVVKAAGGGDVARCYDEAYLDGMAFEDNDVVARLLMACGRVAIDSRLTVYHQSHAQVAYSDSMTGWNTSEEYTRKKYGGGVPFRPNENPLPISRLPGEGVSCLEVNAGWFPDGFPDDLRESISTERAIRDERRNAIIDAGKGGKE